MTLSLFRLDMLPTQKYIIICLSRLFFKWWAYLISAFFIPFMQCSKQNWMAVGWQPQIFSHCKCCLWYQISALITADYRSLEALDSSLPGKPGRLILYWLLSQVNKGFLLERTKVAINVNSNSYEGMRIEVLSLALLLKPFSTNWQRLNNFGGSKNL